MAAMHLTALPGRCSDQFFHQLINICADAIFIQGDTAFQFFSSRNCVFDTPDHVFIYWLFVSMY